MWNLEGGIFFFFRLFQVHVHFLEALQFPVLRPVVGSSPCDGRANKQPKLICLIVGKIMFLCADRDACQRVLALGFYEGRSCNAHKVPTRAAIRNSVLMVRVEAPRLFSTFRECKELK